MLKIRTVAALVAATVASLLLTACPSGGGADDPLVVYSGRNENLVRPLLERYAKETGADISVRYGDTSELLPTILEEGKNTRADVFLSQDAGALGELADKGFLATLPEEVVGKVDERFADPQGRWIGLTSRSRVLAYAPDRMTAADLPKTVFDLTGEQWRGRVGIAPTNASFIAYISALRETFGDDKVRAFLDGLKRIGARRYDNNVVIVDAIDRGEIDVGLVNHYYVINKKKEDPDAGVANFFLPDDDVFVNSSGAGVMATTKRKEQALDLVRFLLSKEAQTYFRDNTSEYPLAAGVSDPPGAPDLGAVKLLDVPLPRLGELLESTVAMLKDVGLT